MTRCGATKDGGEPTPHRNPCLAVMDISFVLSRHKTRNTNLLFWKWLMLDQVRIRVSMEEPMRRLSIAAAVLLCLFFGTNGHAQVINAALTGTVSDSSGALIPGVEITATQTGTGVVSTAL